MKKWLLLLVGLLCCASLAWAGFGYQVQMAGLVPVAGPTMLVGNNPASRTAGYYAVTNQVNYTQAGIVAIASGNLGTGYAYFTTTHSTDRLKICVYNSSYDLVACSAAITPNSGGTETLNSGAFASGSITVGNTYYLGIITNDHWGDAGWGPSFTQGATYTDVVNTTGSYASPPSTINPATDASNTKGNIVVWVTN